MTASLAPAPFTGPGSVEKVVPWTALDADASTAPFATLQADGTFTLDEPGLYLVTFHAEALVGFSGAAPVGDFDVGAVINMPSGIVS